MSREEALINGLMGIGFGGAIGLLGRGISRAARRSGLLDRVPRSTPAPSRICPASFSADTLIATPEGDKPISEIEVGDVILAYSEATEEVDIYHVSATHNQRHDSTLDLTIDGETLHTTDEHPFYVIRDNEEQWVEAKHLQADDRVLAADGTLGVVEAIEIVDKPQTMYNLTVALVATYMVGDGQWVVHNCDTRQILVLGEEGNAPYARDLASIHDDWEVWGSRYGEGINSPQVLVESASNFRLIDNVDGRELSSGNLTGNELFDDIVFNGPRAHAPINPQTRQTVHPQLVQDVLSSSLDVLKPGGAVRVSSGGGMPAMWWLSGLETGRTPIPSGYRFFGGRGAMKRKGRSGLQFLEDRTFGLPSYVPTANGGTKILSIPLEDINWYVFTKQ